MQLCTNNICIREEHLISSMCKTLLRNSSAKNVNINVLCDSLTFRHERTQSWHAISLKQAYIILSYKTDGYHISINIIFY